MRSKANATAVRTDVAMDGTVFQDMIVARREEAEAKAWDALAGYKFWMFGYHAAQWVLLNQLLPTKAMTSNPFRDLVHVARGEKTKREREAGTQS